MLEDCALPELIRTLRTYVVACVCSLFHLDPNAHYSIKCIAVATLLMSVENQNRNPS